MKEMISSLSLLTLILSVISIGVSIYAFVNSFRQKNEHHKTLLFCDYTRRYQDIILAMPDSLYKGDATVSDMEIIRHMRLYFDLCSEEYYLRQKGYIPDDIWKFWVDGMRLKFKDKVYHDAWLTLENDYNIKFRSFINNHILAVNIN
ncbi:MAG: hypothetical protein K2J12_00800 [Muribaculaceae bacterium]|nr:hypothetical protein [Muribaculaceae bacterium]